MKINTQRTVLQLSFGTKNLLLYSCCAPCSGEVMEALLAPNIPYTIFFYNPNIHPCFEYDLLKNANLRFAKKYGVPFVDPDYERDRWFELAKGMENEFEL